jgi:hypothetical protein
MSIPSLNYHLYLNIQGDILQGNYTNIINNSGSYSATHNINLKLDINTYHTNLMVHSTGLNQNLNDEVGLYDTGIFGLKDAFVSIISKTLFSAMNKRAAIRNDIHLANSMYDDINNKVSGILSSSDYQNSFFDQYVNSDKFNPNATGVIDYNFDNVKLQYGLSYHGLINHLDEDIENTSIIYRGKGVKHSNTDIINISTDQQLESYDDTSYQINILLTFKYKK